MKQRFLVFSTLQFLVFGVLHGRDKIQKVSEIMKHVPPIELSLNDGTIQRGHSAYNKVSRGIFNQIYRGGFVGLDVEIEGKIDNKNRRGYAYILDFESWKERIINEFSERNLLDFDYFSISGKKNLSALFDPLSFEGWVNSFFSASYIITDSFHGMVLAIKFKKPFLVLANEKRGVERFTSLLSALALENRIFYKKSISPDNNEVEEIDWKLVSRETEKLKNVSLEFLKDALNDP